MLNLLKGLNDKQKRAVQTTKGPLLVMASAGSGKTKVLTRRVAYLIQQKHVSPYHILAITFTRKAANEMRDRINKLLGGRKSGVWVSTFHTLGIRILKANDNASLIGYHKDFTIASESTQHTLVKNLMKKVLNIDVQMFSPKKVHNLIELAKDKLITPEEYKKRAKHSVSHLAKIAAKVYPLYQIGLRSNQLMDFNDLIMEPVLLFKNHPKILKMCQLRFRYIHVDEYQDTNEAQYKFIHMLASAHHNLCVVGDADQSIYGWRGADMHNILDFSKDYPDAHVIYMEQNYRSTKHILNVANAIISHNRDRVDKKAWTQNPDGQPVRYFNAPSDLDEAQFVVNRIMAYQMSDHLSLNDFAVLYRTNAQSSGIEDALFKAGLKYRIIGGEKFYDRKEIQDIVAYLSLVANPHDNYSFARVVNRPKRGIGQRTVSKVLTFAERHKQSALYVITHVNLKRIKIATRTRKHLYQFGSMIHNLIVESQTRSLGGLTKDIIDLSHYTDNLAQKADSITSTGKKNKERIQYIQRLVSIAVQFDNDHSDANARNRLTQFLNHIQLMSSQDEIDNKEPKVTLMTIHASKGLEYPVVFMIGMEEGLFPSERSSVGSALEEERRLAYVGVTRAQKILYLTSAQRRMIFGSVEWRHPSIFIKEAAPYLTPFNAEEY